MGEYPVRAAYLPSAEILPEIFRRALLGLPEALVWDLTSSRISGG